MAVATYGPAVETSGGDSAILMALGGESLSLCAPSLDPEAAGASTRSASSQISIRASLPEQPPNRRPMQSRRMLARQGGITSVEHDAATCGKTPRERASMATQGVEARIGVVVVVVVVVMEVVALVPERVGVTLRVRVICNAVVIEVGRGTRRELVLDLDWPNLV